jgi:tetrapyrrole methylase family protein/MazG family protein
MEKSFREFWDAIVLERKKCPIKSDADLKHLAKELLSEAEEFKEAVDAGNLEHACDELGDIFWDALAAAIIAEECGDFTIKEALEKGLAKLKRRKPYLFEEMEVSREEAKRIWHEEKAKEKRW